MLLFHCHHPLSKNSLTSLECLLRSVEDKPIVVFREDGIANLKQQNLVSRLNTLARLSVLSSDLASPLSSSDCELLDDIEFVQLCSVADKIIAWK